MGYLGQESHPSAECIHVALQGKFFILYSSKGVMSIVHLLDVVHCAFRLIECFVSFVASFLTISQLGKRVSVDQ